MFYRVWQNCENNFPEKTITFLFFPYFFPFPYSLHCRWCSHSGRNRGRSLNSGRRWQWIRRQRSNRYGGRGAGHQQEGSSSSHESRPPIRSEEQRRSRHSQSQRYFGWLLLQGTPEEWKTKTTYRFLSRCLIKFWIVMFCSNKSWLVLLLHIICRATRYNVTVLNFWSKNFRYNVTLDIASRSI